MYKRGEITMRCINALDSLGVQTVEDLAARTDEDFARIRNVGLKTRREIARIATSLGAWPIARVMTRDDLLRRIAQLEAQLAGSRPALAPGVYRHYKGGLYTLLAVGKHGGSLAPWVIYVSHEHGGVPCVRPVLSEPPCASPEEARERGDGWVDVVAADGTPRFTFVAEEG
jgi:hypothetical protein